MQRVIFSLLRTLHAWGGVSVSLLFMLISLSGSLLVWKTDYLLLTMPAAQVHFSPTAEALSNIAVAIEDEFSQEEVLSIVFASTQLPLTHVSLQNNEFAYFDVQGKLIERWHGNERWEEWLYDLHHRLLLQDIGLNIVGMASLVMVILVIAGILSFWPRRRAFRQGLWPDSSSRLQLLKSHRNLGIIVALPLLLSLITGIMMVYPQQTERLFLESIRNTEDYSAAMEEKIDDVSGYGSGAWLPAMQRALAVFPEGTIRSAQVPGFFSSYRILGLQQTGEWSRNGLSKVYIDADEGYMDLRIDALKLPRIERLYNTAVPLHTANMDKLWYKIALTLSGLCVFFISSMGLVSFIKKFTRPWS